MFKKRKCLQGHRENPLAGGVRLKDCPFVHNFPKSSQSCSIVIDHYLFQCLKAIFICNFHALKGSRTSMAIGDFQCAEHSTISSVPFRAYHGWAPMKNSQQKSFQMTGKRFFEIGLANRDKLPLTISPFKRCTNIM